MNNFFYLCPLHRIYIKYKKYFMFTPGRCQPQIGKKRREYVFFTYVCPILIFK